MRKPFRLTPDCHLRRSNIGLSHENSLDGILELFPRGGTLFLVLLHDRAGGDFLRLTAVTPQNAQHFL
jgi:hypothetical protein